jgi:ABC-type Na+ efflux pump permease subunit
MVLPLGLFGLTQGLLWYIIGVSISNMESHLLETMVQGMEFVFISIRLIMFQFLLVKRELRRDACGLPGYL